MKVILASKSPRRRELLKRVVSDFQVMSPKCREYHFKKWTPNKNAEENALRKARAVFDFLEKKNLPHPSPLSRGEKKRGGIKKKITPQIVIGSDTIVVYKSKMLGKPRSMEEARKMVTFLSGKTHEVITGVVLMIREANLNENRVRIFHETTKVKMKKLTSRNIQEYFLKINPLDKAGAYAIQEAPKVVEKIWGSYTNVVGLPVELLRKELRKLMF